MPGFPGPGEPPRTVLPAPSFSPDVIKEIRSIKESAHPCGPARPQKAFAGSYAGGTTFKLPPGTREQALALPGARSFDPSGKGRRPMKEWVVVPAEHQAAWDEFADAALAFVAAPGPAPTRRRTRQSEPRSPLPPPLPPPSPGGSPS